MEWLLANPGIILAVVAPLMLVLFLVDRYTSVDVMAPVKDLVSLVGILAVSALAYIYGGWLGLGALAFLIVVR